MWLLLFSLGFDTCLAKPAPDAVYADPLSVYQLFRQKILQHFTTGPW